MDNGVKILVGDDDRVNQLVLQGMLKKLGCECSVVGSGASVIESVKAGGVDLLFLDVQLPDINGFDVARKILELPDISPKPMIAFVSGHDASDFRAEMDELGVAFFVTKPVTVDALKKVLDAQAGSASS